MKRFILMAAIFFAVSNAFGQILNEDASGKSSILVKGTSVSINITEAQAQISHNGTYGGKVSDDKKFYNKFIWGFDVKAKNKSGVSDLFSDGKLTPESSLSLLLGKQFTKFLGAEKASQLDVIKRNRYSLEAKVENEYKEQVKIKITASGLSKGEQATLKTKLNDLTKTGILDLDRKFVGIDTSYKSSKNVKIVQSILADLKDWYQMQDANLTEIRQLAEEESDQEIRSRFIKNRTNTIYVRAGGSTTGFTQDNGAFIRNFDSRFTEEISRNFYGELGFMRQWRMNYFGLNVGYANSGNFDKLTSADYKYSSQDTMINSGKLSADKSFKAYSGAFGYYGKVYLAIDYQHLIQLEESKYLSIGPYTRLNKVFSEADLVKDFVVLGASLNYLDGKAGKFLGGIYIQSDDISGKTEPNFGKTIKFGLIVKFSLSTLGLY